MATISVRRKPVATTARTMKRIAKASPTSADQLVDTLSLKLIISDVNGKGKQAKAAEEVVPVEQRRRSAMCAVNSASQALSLLVSAGWKMSSQNSSSSKSNGDTAHSNASSAEAHLNILRQLSPGGDMDLERAAISVVGKLIVLEMHEAALRLIADMHPRLCDFLKVSPHPCKSPSRPQLKSQYAHLISIPLPSAIPKDAVFLTLLSNYLSYALVALAHVSNPSPSHIEDLSHALLSSEDSNLLAWTSCSLPLPSKHMDSALTRAYTAVNKICSASITEPASPPAQTSAKSKYANRVPSRSPSAISLFRIRVYALQCLLHTSANTIAPSTFWLQAIRYAGVYAKSVSNSSEHNQEEELYISQVVLEAYNDLVSRAERRPDHSTFLGVSPTSESRGFVDFCENWITFARKAGDICTLEKIRSIMSCENSPPFEGTPSYEKTSGEKPTIVNEHSASPTKTLNCQRQLTIEGTRVCTSFIQVAVLLEQLGGKEKVNEGKQIQEQDLIASVQECTSLMKSSKSLVTLLQPSHEEMDEGLRRSSSKVERAFEKMRRGAIKLLELSSPSREPWIDEAAKYLLNECANVLKRLLPLAASSCSISDILTRTIDLYFVLAKAELQIADPRSYISTFDYLQLASSTLSSLFASPEKPEIEVLKGVDLANYSRCISGAFYNLAGILYQASRYSAAVPFLREACTIGTNALVAHRQEDPRNEGNRKEQEREGWKQLNEQLCRRWELLGACYIKNGDRKNAYSAFKQSIFSFPYLTTGFIDLTNSTSPAELFESTPQMKQLASNVDRISNIGQSELLLPANEISLHSINPTDSTALADGRITGALLERQLESLRRSDWKQDTRKLCIHLLKDMLDVYSNGMPIRKARTLVRCLQFIYRSRSDDEGIMVFGPVESIGAQIETLLTSKDLGHDHNLVPYCAQYQASAHFWLALHAHRQCDPLQHTTIVEHSDEACRVLTKSLSSEEFGKVIRKSGSPKILKIPPKGVATRSPKVRITKATAIPAAPKKVMGRKKAAVPASEKSTSHQLPINAIPRHSVNELRTAKITSTLLFDDFNSLLELLQLMAEIMGIMSLVLSKVQILEVARKLLERHSGKSSDDYVRATVNLGYEYVKLAKPKKAAFIFNQALGTIKSGGSSNEVSILFFLRVAESLAVTEDIPKCVNTYAEALALSERLDVEDKWMTTLQRIEMRANRLEMAAMASSVFSRIQYAQGNMPTFLESMLQSLRLWNRAVDTLSRLNPQEPVASVASESNPFEMTSLKDALTEASSISIQSNSVQKSAYSCRSISCIEWRISGGLLSTLFALCNIYLTRGSVREAEYFANEALDLSEALNAPAMASSALAKKGEILLLQGKLEESYSYLSRASEKLSNFPSVEAANVSRLRGVYNERMARHKDAKQLYAETVAMLETLDVAFSQFDGTVGLRKSMTSSPSRNAEKETVLPELLAAVIRQHLWLLRDSDDETFKTLFCRFSSLPQTSLTKMEENALRAKLTLHGVYLRFHSDMFLSSIAESTIALPMGIQGLSEKTNVTATQDVLTMLGDVERLFWTNLAYTAKKGRVTDVREATISLALVCALQSSLGNLGDNGSILAACLLDASASITLGREMLDIIDTKFLAFRDDLQWPHLSNESSSSNRLIKHASRRCSFNSLCSNDDDDDSLSSEIGLKAYWESVRVRHSSQIFDSPTLSMSRMKDVPSNWTVIHVSVAEDQTALFISREDGAAESALVFRVPLKGRRDNGGSDDEEAHLTYEGALDELREIVKLSDEGTKAAAFIKPDDEEARKAWWKQRGELDHRMKELLENIEFCWLGAFKTILSPQAFLTPEVISDLRAQFEKVFNHSLHLKNNKKVKQKSGSPKKKTSRTQPLNAMQLDDVLVRCFSTLSPKCRDEELEDLVYFMLDLYQSHGVQVSIAEVDILQVVVDLRSVLEEHATKLRKCNVTSTNIDEHLFLVLDKNLQGIPWENIPILRGRSVSRIPSVDFLLDRIELAKWKSRSQVPDQLASSLLDQSKIRVDPRKGYFVLNPSGDLGKTESRFKPWAEGMKKLGWDGVVGKPIGEQQFLEALKTRELVVYFGHGGGEQYMRSHKIRGLARCAATMLWGCSSGALREMGDFDRVGTPNHYMLAGCPSLVANLWDVTDKDIDKFSQSVFDKLGLTPEGVASYTKPGKGEISIVKAVAQSRNVCKMKYLTGAAPVVYGVPFYF